MQNNPAPVTVRTTIRTTTTQRATRPPIIITLPTERPNRSPAVASNNNNKIPDQNVSPSINTANRFGDNDVRPVSVYYNLFHLHSTTNHKFHSFCTGFTNP